MSHIGSTMPAFHAEVYRDGDLSTLSDVNLHGEYSILFFYPLDFTFVCPTEMHALQEALPEFTKRGATVYGISVDSVHTHRAWVNTPKVDGGIEGITYPLISDLQRTIADSLGVLDASGVALRATVILDKENVIQHMNVNNLSVGRNISEIIRTLDAVQFVAEHGDKVCPANWQRGEEVMTPNADGVKAYLQK